MAPSVGIIRKYNGYLTAFSGSTSSGGGSGGNTARRRKTCISARERNLRRLESNERERMRMHSLNDAFEVRPQKILRFLLPFFFNFLSSAATQGSHTSHKDGKEAFEDRNAYVGQKLHHGTDERHLRNERRRKTLHVSLPKQKPHKIEHIRNSSDSKMSKRTARRNWTRRRRRRSPSRTTTRCSSKIWRYLRSIIRW